MDLETLCTKARPLLLNGLTSGSLAGGCIATTLVACRVLTARGYAAAPAPMRVVAANAEGHAAYLRRREPNATGYIGGIGYQGPKQRPMAGYPGHLVAIVTSKAGGDEVAYLLDMSIDQIKGVRDNFHALPCFFAASPGLLDGTQGVWVTQNDDVWLRYERFPRTAPAYRSWRRAPDATTNLPAYHRMADELTAVLWPPGQA
jgi:hypothetical protein